jgi:rhodanese-related sulfurtransferase
MKIIDIRREDEYEEWNTPGAIYVWMSYVEAERDNCMTKDEKVLLYCDVGVTSKAIAEYLRSLGFKVYYFRYGVPKLKKICDEIAKKK